MKPVRCGFLLCLTLFPLIPLAQQTLIAQDAHAPDFKSSIGVSYSSLRYRPNEQYLGFGVDYRYMVHPWIGVQAEVSAFPPWQSDIQVDAVSTRQLVAANTSVLVGHRWGRVGLFGEVGLGILWPWAGSDTVPVAGGSAGMGMTSFKARNCPDLLSGGLLDVAVGHRLSLTYEVRDNRVFFGPYTQMVFGSAETTPASQLNMPEGRFGVAFHFQEAKSRSGTRPARVQGDNSLKPLKNSFGVSYTTLHWTPIPDYVGQQWIGAGVQYSYMPRPWAGIQLEGSYSPQWQHILTSISGGQLVQATASALIGHRWGKVGIYGQGGFGVLRTKVFGAASQQGASLYLWRDYPDLLLGGVADVALGRRWSVSFNARDNVLFIGPFTFVGPKFPTGYGPYPPSQPYTDNLLEIRTGVSFHF